MPVVPLNIVKDHESATGIIRKRERVYGYTEFFALIMDIDQQFFRGGTGPECCIYCPDESGFTGHPREQDLKGSPDNLFAGQRIIL